MLMLRVCGPPLHSEVLDNIQNRYSSVDLVNVIKDVSYKEKKLLAHGIYTPP